MTTASKITLIRVAFIPVYMVLMYLSGGHPNLWMWLGLAVFVIASLTDYVDGFIARKFHMVSDLGKILDPFADKLTQVAIVGCLAFRYVWMRYLVVFFLLKEFFLGLFGFLVMKYKDEVNSAQWHGKLNTVVLYTVMCLLILLPELPIMLVNALIVLRGAVMLTSFVLYSRFYYRILRAHAKDGQGTK
jgi:cardiolipin synthase